MIAGTLDTPYGVFNLYEKQGPEPPLNPFDTLEVLYKLEKLLFSEHVHTTNDIHEFPRIWQIAGYIKISNRSLKCQMRIYVRLW